MPVVRLLVGMATSFISDEDFTTPAHIRVSLDDDDDDPRSPRSVTATSPDTSSAPLLVPVFLAAIWLVVASVPIGYLGAGRYDVFWNDSVLGITIGVVTIIRLVHPARMAALSWATAGLAAWLLAAPLVLQYGWSSPTANDMIVGVVILICTALSTD